MGKKKRLIVRDYSKNAALDDLPGYRIDFYNGTKIERRVKVATTQIWGRYFVGISDFSKRSPKLSILEEIEEFEDSKEICYNLATQIIQNPNYINELLATSDSKRKEKPPF